MCETSHQSVECYTFEKLATGDWGITHDITDGEYADGMDFLVEAAAHHDHEWSYNKNVSDPF
ncbi:hypothetical protein ACRXCV_00485 (plasmid) [Halobacteriovorax sp. GFR7]|uniref:hypothetical protein n=1 Tax=unclassified Halobacteriovorax TaxID=2639665 RepID=UPI003D95C11F